MARLRDAVAAGRRRAVIGWSWFLDYAYVVRWQVASTVRPPTRYPSTSHPSTLRPTLPPVLALPGVLETWSILRPVLDALAERGHPIHVVDALRRNRGPVAAMATLVEDHLVAHDLHDVVVVAHSKGGLIGKHVMAGPRCADRIRAMVTVATPFGGSVYARLFLAPSIRAFRPDDPTLAWLRERVAVNARITSIAARYDPHIPAGSHLDGATNVVVDVVGHFRILGDARVRTAVLDAVARAVPAHEPPAPSPRAP